MMMKSLYTTSLDILNQVSNDKNLLDYQLARKFIEIEFQTIQIHYNKWCSGHLSEFPIIIYDYNKHPKYYEFRIYDELNQLLGALTILIPKISFPHIFEVNCPQDITAIQNKYPFFGLIDSGYPTVSYCEDINKEEWIIHSFSENKNIQVLCDNNDIYQKLQYVCENKSIDYNEADRKNELDQKDVQSFWKYVDQNRQKILDTVIKVSNTVPKSEKVTANLDPGWNWFVDYADDIYGWCGPSMMTWFISVVADIPDKSSQGIRNLYEQVEGIIGTGPVISPMLNKIFNNPKSPFKTLPYRISQTPILSFQTQKIMDTMKNNKLPIGSLINYLTIGKGWGSWHWRGIFEIEKVSYSSKYQNVFLWWNWNTNQVSNQFEYIYTVFDNGYTLSERPKYVDKYDISSYKGKHFFKERGKIPFVYFFPFYKK